MAKTKESAIPVSHGYVRWRIHKISAEQIHTYADAMPSISERIVAFNDPESIDYRNLRVLRNAVIKDYEKLPRKKQEALFSRIYVYECLVEYALHTPLKARKKLLYQFSKSWKRNDFKRIQQSIKAEEEEMVSRDNRANLFADAASAAFQANLDQFPCPVCGHAVNLCYRSDGNGYRADCPFCESQVSRWNNP